MADDKNNTGQRDRERISLTDEYEVRDWSKKFNVSENVFRNAVREVGNIAKDVEAFLKSGRRK